MEQSTGISIITPPCVTENSVGKSKSIGITLRSNGNLQSAKKQLNAPWLKKLMKEDTTFWDTFLIAFGELIGTAILVFIGCTGCVGSLGTVPSILQVSFVFGFAVMIAIQTVGHISGAHINPAITAAALIFGKVSLPMAGLYVVSQCIGGLLGYGLLKTITPSQLLHGGDPEQLASLCVTDISSKLSIAHGFMAEVLATGTLAFFACGVWDSRNAKNTDSVSLRFGLCVTGLCLVFINYTGCSINPARSLAPAIWNGTWTNHWVYWIGPIGGAVISALIYRCLFSAKTENRENFIQDTGTVNGIET